MKKQTKNILSTFVIAALSVSLSACSLMKKNSAENVKPKATQVNKIEKTGVSLTTYNNVKVSPINGSSYEDVKKMIGKKAARVNKNKKEKTTSYTWRPVKNGLKVGSALNITFKNNHATMKFISGLKQQDDNLTTKANYKKLKKGMTTSEVEKIFGKPNSLSYAKGGTGMDFNIYGYMSSFEVKHFWTVQLTFMNGKLDSMYQSGLK